MKERFADYTKMTQSVKLANNRHNQCFNILHRIFLVHFIISPTAALKCAAHSSLINTILCAGGGVRITWCAFMNMYRMCNRTSNLRVNFLSGAAWGCEINFSVNWQSSVVSYRVFMAPDFLPMPISNQLSTNMFVSRSEVLFRSCSSPHWTATLSHIQVPWASATGVRGIRPVTAPGSLRWTSMKRLPKSGCSTRICSLKAGTNWRQSPAPSTTTGRLVC